MFQKEVANRIISNFNTNNYGRLTVLANWRLNIKKICDIKPTSFYPKPKVESSLLFFEPKENFFYLKIKNLINAEINNGSKDYDPEYIRSHVEKLTS